METKQIGEKIKKLREEKGLTKNALANLAGVSPTYIYQLENGEKCPTVEYLGYICWGLGISLSEFFSESESENESKESEINSLTNEQKALLNAFLKSVKT